MFSEEEMPVNERDKQLVYKSKLYKEYCLMKEQILKYKWIESEKVGKDIGIHKAWLQWEVKYYNSWKKYLDSKKNGTP